MKNIIISPYSRPMRNGKVNPKNYPYWGELVSLLKGEGFFVIQIGRSGEKPIEGVNDIRLDLTLDSLRELVATADTWISVDNFFQHFCSLIHKPGYVIFGPSDPNIFGHKENVNILKDRKYLREKQFDIWEVIECNNDIFFKPEEIIKIIRLPQSIIKL